MSTLEDIFKSYPGSKNTEGVYHKIINLIPPHHTYIEGCLGGGAILRHKRPAAVNIGNDLDPRIYDAWMGYILDGFTMMNEDVLQLISSVVTGKFIDPFLYLDLPYPMESRRSVRRIYAFESTPKLHKGMLSSIANVEFNCMISTYPNKLYADKLKHWRCYPYKSGTHAGAAIELLYMNYPQPTELHDYKFLGNDCWDRLRIKRKIKTRYETLMKLPILEQNAIINGLNDLLKKSMANTIEN